MILREAWRLKEHTQVRINGIALSIHTIHKGQALLTLICEDHLKERRTFNLLRNDLVEVAV